MSIKYGELEDQLYKTWFYKNVGKSIKDKRNDCGNSQEELANALNISRVSMVNIENGKQRLPVHIINDICYLLKCSIADIVPSRSEYNHSKFPDNI